MTELIKRTVRLETRRCQRTPHLRGARFSQKCLCKKSVAYEPTIANSIGINHLMKWRSTLRGGQPGVLKTRHSLGERTRVSHAATVSVHTKKYFCADRWGGRLRDGGSWADMAVGDEDRLTAVVP